VSSCVLIVCGASLQPATENVISIDVKHKKPDRSRPLSLTRYILTTHQNIVTPSISQAFQVRHVSVLSSSMSCHTICYIVNIFLSHAPCHARLPAMVSARNKLQANVFCPNRDACMHVRSLYRQVLVRPLIRARLVARNLQSTRQIRSHDRDIVRETRDRLEELL
jgi:hypothetical protein